MKQQTSLQMLRGIAAFGVVLFHITAPTQPNAAHPFGVGAAGVDIFFVLSGFVMWYATSERATHALDFWKARFIRVAPLYYLYTLVFMLMLYINQGFLFGIPEVLKSLLFIPFNNSLDHQPLPILGVGWTLNYEALFYLLFGCSLVLSGKKWRFLAMAAVFAFLICLRPFAPAGDAVAMRFTSPMFLEFLVGMLIAMQLHRIQRLPGAVSLTLMLVAIGLLAGWGTGWHHIPRTIGAGIPAVLLVTAALGLEQSLKRQPWGAPLKLLGDASYSLYLVHSLFIALMDWYLPPAYRTGAFLPFWIAGTVAAGFASYHWVEKPLLAWMQPRKPLSPRSIAGAHIHPQPEPRQQA